MNKRRIAATWTMHKETDGKMNKAMIYEVLKDHHLVYDLSFWENSTESFFHEKR